jgi:hypothetical protein
MKALFTDEQLQVGTKIKGNENNAIMQIIKIENSTLAAATDNKFINRSAMVTLKDCKTGNIFQYGLEALKRCNISIIEQ